MDKKRGVRIVSDNIGIDGVASMSIVRATLPPSTLFADCAVHNGYLISLGNTKGDI